MTNFSLRSIPNRFKKQALMLLLLVVGLPMYGGEGSEEPKHSRYHYGLWTDLRFGDGDLPAQESFFKPAHLSLYGGYTFNSRWSLFGELAMQRETDLFGSYDTDTGFERLYFQYDWSDRIKLRVGKIDNPVGIIKPIHWLITLDSIQRPILEDNSYLPAKVTGIELFGSRFTGTRSFKYSLTLSHTKNEVRDDQPINRAKGIGLDLQWQEHSRFLFGGTVAHYRDPKDKDRTATGYMPYGELPFGSRLLLRSEFLYLRRENGPDVRAWYAKAKWDLKKWAYLNVRHDQGHDERSLEGRERRTQALTLGFKVGPHWRFRLEGRRHHLEGVPGHFSQWDAWAGWIF